MRLQVSTMISLSHRKSNLNIPESPPPRLQNNNWVIKIRSHLLDFLLTRRGSTSTVVNVSATSVSTGLKLKVSYISFDSRDTDKPVSLSMFVLTPPISTLANQQLFEIADNLTKEGLVKV